MIIGTRPGEHRKNDECLVMIEEINSKQRAILDQLGFELHCQAWEFFYNVKPEKKEDETKVMKKLCQVRTEACEEMLKKLRNLNSRHKDIFLRPSHSSDPQGVVRNNTCIAYPYFVLDDVKVDIAKNIAVRHRCFVVHTSREGGCQVWVICSRPIDKDTRYSIQSYFSAKGISDKGAVSGTQIFRFPHFKNYKRGGQWVNVIHVPNIGDIPFDADTFLAKIKLPKNSHEPPVHSITQMRVGKGVMVKVKQATNYQSQSEADWHEVIERLRSGENRDAIVSDLQVRSVKRGKHRTYANRTVEKAVEWLNQNSVLS